MLIRIALALYVLCIFALVASYFAVSGADLGAAMYLQAPSKLQADLPNAARGIVMDAPTGRLYVEADTQFTIEATQIGNAATAGHGHLHALLRPPEALAGPRKLDVTIDHPLIDEPFAGQADVHVEAGPQPFVWPPGTSRVSDEKEAVPTEWEGELEVKVIPPDGQIPRGLPSAVYLLLVDRETQAPVSGTIQVTKLEGMLEKGAPAEPITTDEMGLVKLPLTATTNARLTITATQDARTGQGTVRFTSVASQFSLAPQQLLAVPNQPVRAHVTSLHRSGGILVDLYDGGRWAAADAFGISPSGAGVQIVVPEDVQGPLVRMQVYQDLFDAGTAWDARWLVTAPTASPDECRVALRTVLELHQTHSERYARWATHARQIPDSDDRFRAGRCEQWLEAALLAVPHSFVPAPMLLNTQKGDREKLEQWKKQVQSRLIVATAGVLFVGFALVLLLVLQGLARREQTAHALREVHLETASEAELAEDPGGVDLDRLVIVTQTIIIVLTLFTFGASLLMLLSWM